jgi:hypothetical protein
VGMCGLRAAKLDAPLGLGTNSERPTTNDKILCHKSKQTKLPN